MPHFHPILKCTGKGQPWTLEVLRLPRKIILQALVCEESSITISCSSFLVIDDTTIWKRACHKLTVATWARYDFLKAQFSTLLEGKRPIYVYLYLPTCLILGSVLLKRSQWRWSASFIMLFVNHRTAAKVHKGEVGVWGPSLLNDCHSVLWLLMYQHSQNDFLNFPTYQQRSSYNYSQIANKPGKKKINKGRD